MPLALEIAPVLSKPFSVWFASSNPHKKAELCDILRLNGADWIIKSPADANIVFDPEETGANFYENALIKAHALYNIVHEPVLADDSGLCVDALNGKPGIFSARYGSCQGRILESGARNELLLKELAGAQNRNGRFVCAMVLLLDKNHFFIAQETLEGTITSTMSGSGGFGYDPLLHIAAYNATVAALSPEIKNRISHRAKALHALIALSKTHSTADSNALPKEALQQ